MHQFTSFGNEDFEIWVQKMEVKSEKFALKSFNVFNALTFSLEWNNCENLQVLEERNLDSITTEDIVCGHQRKIFLWSQATEWPIVIFGVIWFTNIPLYRHRLQSHQGEMSSYSANFRGLQIAEVSRNYTSETKGLWKLTFPHDAIMNNVSTLGHHPAKITKM